MKTRKIWMIISLIVLAIQLAAEIAVLAIILKLNVLPDKYLMILYVVLALPLLLTGCLMFLRFKKPVSLARRIVAWAIALIVIVCSCIVAVTAADTYSTLKTVTGISADIEQDGVFVLVRLDDPAQTYADTANYTYGMIAGHKEAEVSQAIVQIGEEIGVTLQSNSFERLLEAADALLNGQMDVWVVHSAALAWLIEEEDYLDYMSKVRVLGEVPVSSLKTEEPSTEPPTEPPEVPRTIDNSPFVIYISGSDTRNKKLRTSRSDVNILGVVNPVTKQVLLINTPRDSYVPNPEGNGQRDKLTNCGLYGPSNSMEVLGTLYDLEIDYYCQINFTGFKKMIDAVGGITIYSDQAFSTIRDMYIRKGENHLNGEEALALVRERYHVKGGDRGRGENQMKVIQALISKLTSGTTIISNYSSILQSLEGLFRTDVSMDEISALVKMQLTDMASWNVQVFAVSGTGGSDRTYSSPGHNAYVMYLDEKLVSYASMLADRVIAGEILTAEDVKIPE